MPIPDEAASIVDTRTEKRLQEALNELMAAEGACYDLHMSQFRGDSPPAAGA
ncbi:MAG: hypothetical protein ACXV5Q_15545 [Frankiaceae bacterium]